MPSDKRNTIMAIATALIFLHWSASLCPETCLFANCSNSNACIMVLPKLSFVLHSFLHNRVGDDLWYMHQCKTQVRAVQAGVLLALFLAWNVGLTFEELEAKRSTMIHCVKVTHPLLSTTGVYILTIMHSVFFVMAGLIVEMLFMLLSVHNTA